MEKRGLIVENKGGRSQVLVFREEACGSCENCKACDAKPQEEWVENSLGAREGDLVLLHMDNKAFFKSALFLYVLPLVLFLAGILTAWLVQQGQGEVNDLITFAGGLVGLLVFWLIARRHDKTHEAPAAEMAEVIGPDDAAFQRFLEGGF